jgi:hypothetical protein
MCTICTPTLSPFPSQPMLKDATQSDVNANLRTAQIYHSGFHASRSAPSKSKKGSIASTHSSSSLTPGWGMSSPMKSGSSSSLSGSSYDNDPRLRRFFGVVPFVRAAWPFWSLRFLLLVSLASEGCRFVAELVGRTLLLRPPFGAVPVLLE